MTNIGVLTFLWLLFEKRYRGFICFIIPFLCFAAAQLAINRFVMGSITSFTHLNATSCFVKLSQLDVGFLLKRIDVLINKTHGFLPFAPFLIYGLVAMFRYAGRRNTGLVSLLNIGFFLLIWSNGWMGVGYQYAGRYFLPMIPLLSVPTQQWYDASKRKSLQTIFWALVVVSFLINFQAAFMYGGAASKTPWFVIDILRDR